MRRPTTRLPQNSLALSLVRLHAYFAYYWSNAANLDAIEQGIDDLEAQISRNNPPVFRELQGNRSESLNAQQQVRYRARPPPTVLLTISHS